MNGKLGFWGAGKMAEGILSAALKSTLTPSDIFMAEKDEVRRVWMAQTYAVHMSPSVLDVAQTCESIFLAVRPQDLAAVASAVAPALDESKLVISIAAGQSLSRLRSLLGSHVRLIRVMPNLALRAQEGMCVFCPDETATSVDIQLVQDILNAAGRTLQLEEKHFDAVTALSGSGPAFFAAMEQAMAKGGEALGLPPDAARLLSEQTMLGTAAFLRQSAMPLNTFISGVATPGGTTAAGMKVLGASDFEEIVAHTLSAAAQRSAQLGS